MGEPYSQYPEPLLIELNGEKPDGAAPILIAAWETGTLEHLKINITMAIEAF